MNRMTDQMTVVQARISARAVHQLDHDAESLGIGTRSEAVRAGLRLLHREARHAALAGEYDRFYGGEPAPVSDVAAIGEHIAADAIAER